MAPILEAAKRLQSAFLETGIVELGFLLQVRSSSSPYSARSCSPPAAPRIARLPRRSHPIRMKEDIMNDNPVLICYDGSDDAKLAIERAGDLFEARRAIVLTVWQSAYLQIAPYALGGVAYATDVEEVDGASVEFAAKRAKEGTELARAAGLCAEPVHVNARGPIWQTVL